VASQEVFATHGTLVGKWKEAMFVVLFIVLLLAWLLGWTLFHSSLFIHLLLIMGVISLIMHFAGGQGART
jgi:hypothetical protein